MSSCFIFSDLSFAQDIDAPAGDVGGGDYDYSDYGSDDVTSDTSETTSKTDGLDDLQKIIKETVLPSSKKSESTASETWDSYSNLQAGSVIAEDVTDGVRVEDIVEPPSDYQYAAFGLADPFVPPLLSRDNSIGAVEIPIVSPLQQYSLDELSVVGIWQMPNGERKSMVVPTKTANLTPQGIIVKVGDPIGNRGGKIIGIGEDYMTVREFLLSQDGTREFEDVQLFMGDRVERPVTGTITFEPGAKDPKVALDDPKTIEEDDSSRPLGGAGSLLSPEEKIAPLENVAPIENVAPVENVSPVENVAPIENAQQDVTSANSTVSPQGEAAPVEKQAVDVEPVEPK